MAPITRGMRARAAASADRIPADALFDALLLLPAKDLCRLRAVCRRWRGLVSDPVFVAAHGARRPSPLFVAKFHDDKTSIYVVDLSGGVVKRIAGAGSGPYHQLICTRLSLACVATDWNRCSVVNPAIGAVHVLPWTPAPEHWNRVNQSNPYTLFALGRVAATGEHKVFRMFNRLGYRNGGQQVFEVFTVNASDGHARRWRGLQRPGLCIDECSGGTVVDGVVYFLTYSDYDVSSHGIRPDYILSFDLGVEKWRRDLRGPISSKAGDDEVPNFNRRQLSLAELNGHLVLAHHNQQPPTMDLWFLMDFGRGLWAKQYHIQTGGPLIRPADEYSHLKPLLLLDDGRLVVYVAGRLFICDTGTSTFEPVNMRRLDSVAVYTGNLLSLE